jgi:polyhydroxyalkanoate synthesis regulator phasin
MMTQSNQPESIDNSIDRKLDTIMADISTIKLDIAAMKPQLDRVEKRLDGIDNRLWVFMGGILTAALAALLRLIPEV